MQTVTILAEREQEALAAMRKLEKKAIKYGCPDIKFVRGEVRTEARTIFDGEQEYKIEVQVVDYTLTGEAPVVGDYTFLAKVEFEDAGILLKETPGNIISIDQRFRNTDRHCDHCNSARRRNEVFVLQNNVTGEQVQVGRTCLRDYTGIDTLEHVMNRYKFFQHFREANFEDYLSFAKPVFYISTCLAQTFAAINVYGWMSKAQAGEFGTATVTRVADMNTQYPLDPALVRHYQENQEVYKIQAEEVLAWVNGLPEEKLNNEYMRNLKVILSGNVAQMHNRGLVCSAVAAYIKDVEATLRLTNEYNKKKESEHFGVVGTRYKNVIAFVDSVRVVGYDKYSYYGQEKAVQLFSFITEDGDVLVWFSSSDADAVVGKKVVLDFTVKSHGEYKGIKQTTITRAKIKEEK